MAMITPGKNTEAFQSSLERGRHAEEKENSELFQFDKTGNLSVRYLRESYNAAKARASELNTNAGLSGNLRSHCQQTIRIYSALATLLYSTISISKADDLERFVRKRSLQVPNSLFDIDEWKPVLQIARNVRMGENGKYMDELGAFKSFMKLRMDRLLVGAKIVVTGYKRMKDDVVKELEALKANMEDFKYKVLPYLQRKLSNLNDENQKLERENRVLNDSVIAKDVEIKELIRSKAALEQEHASHVERVKKESFEAIAFAKSKIETQQSAHRAEITSLNRQHEAKLSEMRKSFDAQILQSSISSKEVIDRLTTEREWLQKTHATVLSNADKMQAQFKAQCDSEVARLEKRYEEAMATANSRLASESSNAELLMKSTIATYEAKISSANAAREYETNMLQVKLDELEKRLQETNLNLEKSEKRNEGLSQQLLQGEAELISKRSEYDNMKENHETLRKQHESLKESNNSELERLRLQLNTLFDEKSAMVIELGTVRSERDDLLHEKEEWGRELDNLRHKERTLSKEKEDLQQTMGVMESEKCRLMSYYDEKCQQCNAQKKEITALKDDKAINHRRQLVKEEETTQLLNNLEADKSRLMSYYDEKCLQSDAFKKKVKSLESEILYLNKLAKEKESENIRVLSEIEADKSRLMGYYDEKCLQIGNYKKQLAKIEKAMKAQDNESIKSLRKEVSFFKKQMSIQEMYPLKTVNVRKEACDIVQAVSRVIAEYTVDKCIVDFTSKAKHSSSPRAEELNPFVSRQYDSTSIGSNADDLKRISELEVEISSKKRDIITLNRTIEEKDRAISNLQGKLSMEEKSASKSASNVKALKDKINEVTKENYHLNEEIAKVQQALADEKGNVATSHDNARKEESLRIQNLEKELLNTRSQLTAAQVELTNNQALLDASRNSHNREVDEKNSALIQNLEKDLLNTRSQLTAVQIELANSQALLDSTKNSHNRDIDEKNWALKSRDSTISELQKKVADLKGSNSELEAQMSKMKEDPGLTEKIQKIQAITRGFNARSRVKQAKMHRDAKTSGVLVATKHTKQGESGWYCAPDGSLYYFVLDGDEWILTCGPISRELFDETVRKLKPQNSLGQYLKLSQFELVTQAVDQPGDLYMSVSNWKLYFAVSVDHLVTDNR